MSHPPILDLIRQYRNIFGATTRTQERPRTYFLVRAVQALPFQVVNVGSEEVGRFEVDGENTRSPDSELNPRNILVEDPVNCRTLDVVSGYIERGENGHPLSTTILRALRWVGTTDIRINGRSYGIPGEHMDRPQSSVEVVGKSVIVKVNPGGFFGREFFGSIVGSIVGGGIGGAVMAGLERWVSSIRPITPSIRPFLNELGPELTRMVSRLPQARIVSVLGALAGGTLIGSDVGAWVGGLAGRAIVSGPKASVELEITDLDGPEPKLVLRNVSGTLWPDFHLQVLVVHEDKVVSFTGLAHTVVPPDDYRRPNIWNAILSQGERPLEFSDYRYHVIAREQFEQFALGRPLLRPEDMPGVVSKNKIFVD